MSDLCKLREALDLVVERFETAYAEPPGIDEVLDAARDYLALLESDAIVIKRGVEGNWPVVFTDQLRYVRNGRGGTELSFDSLRRALADSSKAPE